MNDTANKRPGNGGNKKRQVRVPLPFLSDLYMKKSADIERFYAYHGAEEEI